MYRRKHHVLVFITPVVFPSPNSKCKVLNLRSLKDSSYTFQPYEKRVIGIFSSPSNNIPSSLCSITSVSLQQNTTYFRISFQFLPSRSYLPYPTPSVGKKRLPGLLFLHRGEAQAWENKNYNVWNARKLFCSPTFFSSQVLQCFLSFFVSQQQFRNFALINLGKEYLHRQTLAKTHSTAAEKVLTH